jgi:ubiquinone/menaquinone biosynthesis C-methylase UbiE
MAMSTETEQQLLELQKTLYASKNPTRRNLHCTRRDWIIDAILRNRPANGGKALEIGPGSGVYLPTLAENFAEVVASDVERAFLTEAESLRSSNPNISVVEDNIVASKLPEANFDLILCTEVIEHIAQGFAALQTIRRIVKPNGVLILSTPQRYSTLELAGKIAFLPGIIQMVRLVYSEPIIATGHINLMTAAAMQRQIRDAGFSIKESFISGLYIPLVAEFLGELGLRFEHASETLLKRIGLTGILWTQFYVAVPLANGVNPGEPIAP